MHKPSGRLLDIYTDMPCVFINTAQDFPNYGKMLFQEEIVKITDIATPTAKFGKNGSEELESFISDEYKSISEQELLLPEEGQDDEFVSKTPSTLSSNNTIQQNEPIIGKTKIVYNKHSGVCIRPQLFPDAVTHVSYFIYYKLILIICISLIFSRKTLTI